MEPTHRHAPLPDEAQRLKLAVEASAILGTWYWDVPGDRFIADARFADSFGLDPAACAAGLTLAEVAASIHPEDWPGVEAAVSSALQAGGRYRCTYRVRRADGHYHWVEASGSVELDAGGRALRFPGLLFDVEARVQAETARDRADALLRTFIEAVPGVVYAKDREGRLIVANRGVAELVGKPPSEFIGRTDLDILDDKDQARDVMATDARIMRSGVPEQLEEAVRLADGTMAWWLSSKSPLRDESGRIIGLVGSSVDITERRQQRDSERAARAEAERANAIKDEFLATVSHELRTPLNAILGWAHILQRAGSGDASVAKAAEVIQRAARAQAQLIDDLLDMSRITSGKLRLERRVVDPCDVVTAAVEAARPAAEAAGVPIRVLAGGKPVVGDPARLQQVVWNLVSNAVKFSRSGDAVEVSVDADEAWCRIQVRDQGAGIAPEFLGLIFERFRQADGSSTRRFGGLGLGLSIVRHIVEAHGGRVAVHSDGLGKGACFTVLLPHAARDQLPDGVRDAAETRLDGCQVLVVDDMDDARELMVRVLQDAGATVRAAPDATSALREFAAFKPDAVVSDVSMPGMDGFELARRIRRLPPEQGGQVPLLALTAFTRPSDRLLALQSGFSRHLPKPLEPLQLVHELAALLERSPA